MLGKLTEGERRLIKNDYNFDKKTLVAFEDVYSQLHGRVTLQELLFKYRKLGYDPAALQKYCKSIEPSESNQTKATGKQVKLKYVEKVKNEQNTKKLPNEPMINHEQVENDKHSLKSLTTLDSSNKLQELSKESQQKAATNIQKVKSDFPLKITYYLMPDGTIKDFSMSVDLKQ